MHKKTAFIILSAPLLALLPALHAAEKKASSAESVGELAIRGA